MIRVSVVVSTGAVSFMEEVRAESIEEAVRLASTHYPGREARVLFPIEAETFFCRGLAAAARVVPQEASVLGAAAEAES